MSKLLVRCYTCFPVDATATLQTISLHLSGCNMTLFDVSADTCVTLQQAYVPVLYEDLVGHPGPIGHLANPRGPPRGKMQRPFNPTSPKPMAFELRAQSRPKTIMRVMTVVIKTIQHHVVE